jgi:hypothetical protein
MLHHRLLFAAHKPGRSSPVRIALETNLQEGSGVEANEWARCFPSVIRKSNGIPESRAVLPLLGFRLPAFLGVERTLQALCRMTRKRP